jgi:glycosyltransferase involved in cell wall biosynthesis
MPITVLQIIPNLGAGGGEQACIDMTAGLTARCCRALVVSAGGRRVAEIARLGGEHFEQPVASKNPVKIIKNAFWLARFIRAQKVDIVHARSRAPAWSAGMAARMTKRPFVTTFNAIYKFSNPFKKAYNRSMARGDVIIAISRFVADHIREAYAIDPKKIRIIYRGIDLEKFSPARVTDEQRAALRQSWNVRDGQRLILLPARLSPIKGQALFIKAMALLSRRSPKGEGGLPADTDAVAVIVGDDQGREGYRRELEELIRANNLQDKVRLVKHCADMPAAYSLVDLVVMPSFVPEGFGRVPVEAMAMGVPVIASDLGATRETVVENETGWLLPPENPEKWAAAIKQALSLSPEQRAQMAHKAVRRVQTLFNRKNMIAETLAVYDAIMSKGA